jgi:aryl-alcohol dehydrogenase-like predicted oxidoreductase
MPLPTNGVPAKAQVALAWLRCNPVLAAPIVGVLKIKHIDDSIGSARHHSVETNLAFYSMVALPCHLLTCSS